MADMKIIQPLTITDALLFSSTIAEPSAGEVVWNPATAYTAGNEVIRTTNHLKYKRLISGTTATAPELDAINWISSGTSNKWAMFDKRVGTLSTIAAPLTTVIRPATNISGLSAMELTGKEAVVSMKDVAGGSVVYSKTVSLDGTIINSFYEWFFNDYTQLSDFSLTDMPSHYGNPEITFTVTSTAGNVSCGVLVLGKVHEMGITLSGATTGIIDYSKKEVDTFGITALVQRSFQKKASYTVLTERSLYNRNSKLLASLRATPAVYIGEDSVGYEPLQIYGFYKDFSINAEIQSKYLMSLEIEGLT